MYFKEILNKAMDIFFHVLSLFFVRLGFFSLIIWIGIKIVIIQQIVTLSKYGHDALDIRHP